ncbi:IS701 family transposase, partial [Aliidongia sp.]|uniref:IS701 family transposase n=1 Tax=Aliidongia sp. TaxID=1914230 RepID=UPI003BB8F757
LLLPGERKSVEPIAAVTAPVRVAAQHQSLLHFVGNAPWSDERVLARVRELVLPPIERSVSIEAWIIDDTGFPKKGRHSVGVARQYCGQLGKQDNCQVAVTRSVANHAASLPVAYRLYLPEDWAADPVRRSKAGVPQDVSFQTKPEIALDQIRAALAAEVPKGVVLMDAGYGADTALRTEITSLDLAYVAGIQPQTSVWARRSPGARARPTGLSRAMPGFGSALPTATRSSGSPGPRNGSWSNGRRARPSRPSIGSLPCRPTSPSPNSSTSPSCAGGSSATIKNSSKNSALATTKGAAGEASIITRHCASPPTDS